MSCAEAGTGGEAIDVARECKPDLIILDVAMPVMNGIEAAPKLRQLLPNTPIILFTHYGDFLGNTDMTLWEYPRRFQKANHSTNSSVKLMSFLAGSRSESSIMLCSLRLHD